MPFSSCQSDVLLVFRTHVRTNGSSVDLRPSVCTISELEYAILQLDLEIMTGKGANFDFQLCLGWGAKRRASERKQQATFVPLHIATEK